MAKEVDIKNLWVDFLQEKSLPSGTSSTKIVQIVLETLLLHVNETGKERNQSVVSYLRPFSGSDSASQAVFLRTLQHLLKVICRVLIRLILRKIIGPSLKRYTFPDVFQKVRAYWLQKVCFFKRKQNAFISSKWSIIFHFIDGTNFLLWGHFRSSSKLHSY